MSKRTTPAVLELWRWRPPTVSAVTDTQSVATDIADANWASVRVNYQRLWFALPQQRSELDATLLVIKQAYAVGRQSLRDDFRRLLDLSFGPEAQDDKELQQIG